jgi:SAM-dependent methyltransferase
MAQGKTGAATRRARARILNTLEHAPAPIRGQVGRALLASYRWFLALRGEDELDVGPPGDLPIPPARLRVLVGLDLALSTSDFLREGRAQAALISEMVGSAVPWVEVNAVLDFGCGCGRVARWLADIKGPEFHGCDYDPGLVHWCDANLPFLHATTNRLEPPLPYARNSFEVVYSLSVLTHMPDSLEYTWLLELRRVLAPGGALWFSVAGDWYRHKMTPDQLAAYERGERVTRFDELPGTNLCTAWHPPSFVGRRLSEIGFELIDTVPGSDERFTHDSYLVRKSN